MPGTPIQALWQWSGPHAAAKVYLFCRFRFTFDGLPRRDRPYRAYGREHNRSPMQRCTLEAEKRFTFATGQCRERRYRRCGNGQGRTPLQRCTNLCRFRFTFDGHPRGDRPYRAYGREHNRSPMQRCTNSPRFRFTFDGHPRGDRPYRTYGSGSHRQPSAQVYQFVPFSVHLCRRATLKPSLQTLLQCSGPHGTAKVYPKSGKTVHL